MDSCSRCDVLAFLLTTQCRCPHEAGVRMDRFGKWCPGPFACGEHKTDVAEKCWIRVAGDLAKERAANRVHT